MQLALCVHVDNVGPHIDRMAAAAARSKMRAKWQREKFGINFHSIGFWKTPWSWGCRLNAGSKTTNVCRCRVCLTNLLLFFLCCFSGYFFFFHSFLLPAFVSVCGVFFFFFILFSHLSICCCCKLAVAILCRSVFRFVFCVLYWRFGCNWLKCTAKMLRKSCA